MDEVRERAGAPEKVGDVPHQLARALKYLPDICGAVLGLFFAVLGVLFFLQMLPSPPPPPEGSPAALFMAAMFPTGYLTFVKVLEIAGGVLVAIPRTRNFGLLILGPIIVNILAFHVFITRGAGLFDPPLLVIVALSAYLLWAGRAAFAGLLDRPRTAATQRL